MKRFIILIVLLFSCLLVSCSQKPEKSEREKRKGYAELKVYRCYYDNDDKIDMEDKTLIQHDTYDGEGNVVARVIMEDIKDEIYKYGNEFNKYNENNILVESTYFNSDGEKDKYTIIKYDESNIITEKTIEYYRYYSKETYKYDNKGNEISYTYHYQNRLDVEISFSNQYNNKNQLIQQKAIAKRYKKDKLDRVENLTLNYKYDDKGLIIESPKSIVTEYTTLSEYCWRWFSWVHPIDIENYSYRYRYNDNRLIIEQQEYNNEYNKYQDIIKYNYNDKNLITEINFPYPNPFITLIYEYN